MLPARYDDDLFIIICSDAFIYQVFQCNINNLQSHYFKNSFLIISMQLCGFNGLFIFNDNHLFAYSYMVSSNK